MPKYQSISTSKPGILVVHGKLTGAADVNANGYTVTDSGGGVIASAVKNGEGVIDITLDRHYPALLMVTANCTRADSQVRYTSDTMSTAGALKLTCTEAASATDPDGATILIEITLRNTGVER